MSIAEDTTSRKNSERKNSGDEQAQVNAKGKSDKEQATDDSSAPSTSMLKSVLTLMFVSLFGIVFALLVIEGGFRLLSKSATPAKTWSDRPAWYYKNHAATTMQDFPYPTEKPPNTFRIVVLGDSFSFGTSMQFDDTFPKKLERILNQAGPERAEVINLGVPGYSTSHEAALLKKVFSYQPDLLLLQITLNDPQLKPYTPTGITGKNQFSAIQSSAENPGLFKHWKSAAYVFQRLHNSNTHQEYQEYYFDLFEGKRSWGSFHSALQTIRKRSKRKKIPVLAVTFPLFGLPLNESYPFFPIHEKIESTLENLQIPNLDLYDTYRGLPLARIQLIPGVDFHPNEIGHRMAAEQIYDWLIKQDAIPEEYRISDRFTQRLNIVPEKNSRVAETSNSPENQ